ncbi:hypothetical protein GN244_ATG02208 [Phytophthora infestans]|uniref:Uncharacterized protein n=1 Tax=Phytophthora infestans TaxID=4787 RepID=A0A833T351_PHYIN|nr:hypothetical protein GN244_ATG02208 [Phytophthora infestans]KAF4130995.1 hypothetical protein GN958_ATG19814 [Phytophthora infestans]KAF4142079.1 hypothetical protein GN958_ATG08713 [Phytophthora infestans]
MHHDTPPPEEKAGGRRWEKAQTDGRLGRTEGSDGREVGWTEEGGEAKRCIASATKSTSTCSERLAVEHCRLRCAKPWI